VSPIKVLDSVPDALQEIALALPDLQKYAEKLPSSPDPKLEKALVDVYAEIICFCAYTIHFLRDRQLDGTVWR
jgi:hypothetical protein